MLKYFVLGNSRLRGYIPLGCCHQQTDQREVQPHRLKEWSNSDWDAMENCINIWVQMDSRLECINFGMDFLSFSFSGMQNEWIYDIVFTKISTKDLKTPSQTLPHFHIILLTFK